MALRELSIESVRSIQNAELTLDPHHNLVWGPNGSGKTSLLEAIFMLGRGRSFRTRATERLIRHGDRRLTVFGRTDGEPALSLGVQVERQGGTVAKIGGAQADSLAELTHAFPVQAIDPGIHKLVEEGAGRRRRWMDWGVFHVEPLFADRWLRYARGVRQRNAALRQQPAQAFAWDPELAANGEWVSDARQRFISYLHEHWRTTVRALAGLDVELHYMRGWSGEVTLLQALHDSRARDETRAMTHSGPHRADIVLRLDNHRARDVLSRGQQKLVAIALVLAQLRLLRDKVGLTPTLLLDDPAAELDPSHLERFIGALKGLTGQLIFTSLHRESAFIENPEKVFHVERGSVRAV